MEDGHDTDPPEGTPPRQIIAAIILLAALLGAGLWLTAALRSTGSIQDCAMAGRTNCAPIH